MGGGAARGGVAGYAPRVSDDLVRKATPEERADVRAMHESNRAAWNEGATYYTRRIEESIAFLRAGRMNLEPVELDHLGKLDGCRRAIHLQCASGRDTLSLWNLGAAEVVGVDISDVHIANAERLSAALGAPARWVRSDVLEVPPEFDGSADLVYTGKGAIYWLHDPPAWGRAVARLLAPGGRLYLHDSHPITYLFDMNADTWRWSGCDYFDSVEASRGWPAQYIGALQKPDAELATKFERLWTIGDILGAVIGAGLQVERFTEHREDFWDCYPHVPPADQGKIPRTFSLVARRA
jgi:SAM-dependent methyltransferase